MSKRRRGASLLEVILMMTILAIAATSGMFIAQGWSGRRQADETARTIEDTLNAAREIAVRNRTSVAVTCERINGRWQLELVENAGPLRRASAVSQKIDLGSQISFARTKSTILFAADSSVSGALSWLPKSAGEAITITVDPKTGSIGVKS